MSFVNRELEESEQREYILKHTSHPYRDPSHRITFSGGTIDDENDVRLFIYGDARGVGPDFVEITDLQIKYGLMDYKGEVFFFKVRQKYVQWEVHWSVDYPSWLRELGDEKIEYLREALRAYGIEGYAIRSLWDNSKGIPVIEF